MRVAVAVDLDRRDAVAEHQLGGLAPGPATPSSLSQEVVEADTVGDDEVRVGQQLGVLGVGS